MITESPKNIHFSIFLIPLKKMPTRSKSASESGSEGVRFCLRTVVSLGSKYTETVSPVQNTSLTGSCWERIEGDITVAITTGKRRVK